MRANADSPRETVTCTCKTCQGAQALVPVPTLAGASTPDAIHNYVSMAHHIPSAARRVFIERA